MNQSIANMSSLQDAAKNGDADKVKQLLGKGAPVDEAPLPLGMTALQLASLNNDPAVVVILLDHHASVDLADADGCTPLHNASLRGNIEVMRHLLAAGASRDVADALGYTALEFAGNKTAAVELLNEWTENQAVEEVNIQTHAGSQVMGGVIRTVWQVLPQVYNLQNCAGSTGEILT